jgi:DnaK suppressor protein
MLNEIELKEFKTALEERKRKIENNLDATSVEMNDMRRNELKDEGDHAAMSLETAVDNAILGQQVKELAEIELALGKIQNHLYGKCEMCEEEINVERLKVKNFARFCITCREVVEKDQK